MEEGLQLFSYLGSSKDKREKKLESIIEELSTKSRSQDKDDQRRKSIKEVSPSSTSSQHARSHFFQQQQRALRYKQVAQHRYYKSDHHLKTSRGLI